MRVVEAAAEEAELLDGRDDDLRIGVEEMFLQDLRRGARIRRALLEAVVFLHRLIVEVAAVDDEEHLLHLRHLRGEERRLEGGERLARARRVPDVAAGARIPEPAVIAGDDDAREDALGRGN